MNKWQIANVTLLVILLAIHIAIWLRIWSAS